MAQFPGLSLTVQGNKMILKSSTGKTEDRLIITKAVIGDGQLTASIDGLTEIVSKKLEIGLSQVKEVANGQMQLQFNFDNRKVEIGFFWREVGLYAKNGDSGEEKLIGYSNAKGLTSYIPDKTNVIPMQRLVIALGVGDNPNVKGEVDFASTITLEQLETAIDTHNKAAEAHKEQFKTISEKITAIEDSKVDKTSADYIKSLVTNVNGLEATKGNGTKELLKLLTNVDTDDKQSLAPTLELVKTLLSNLNIKNADDVIKAIEDKKESDLGIRYDFTNPNGWYICLGKLLGNFIIQGGNNLVRGNREATITLPISYSKFFIPVSNPEYDGIKKFNINMVSMYSGREGLNKVHLTTDVLGDSDVDKEIYCWWLTVGV